MGDIKFTKDELERMVYKVKAYFNEELDQDIGGFDAEFIIAFFSKELGPHFYNRGLSDAQALFNEKADELSYSVQELEKPIV